MTLLRVVVSGGEENELVIVVPMNQCCCILDAGDVKEQPLPHLSMPCIHSRNETKHHNPPVVETKFPYRPNQSIRRGSLLTEKWE
jgi:hypothetical protein